MGNPAASTLSQTPISLSTRQIALSWLSPIWSLGKTSRSTIRIFKCGAYRFSSEATVLPAGPPPIIRTSHFTFHRHSEAKTRHQLLKRSVSRPKGRHGQLQNLWLDRVHEHDDTFSRQAVAVKVGVFVGIVEDARSCYELHQMLV